MVVSLYSWSRDDTPVPGLSGHVDRELFSPLRSEACKVDLQLATPPTLSSRPEAGWIVGLRSPAGRDRTGTSGGNTQRAEQTRTTQSAGNKHGAQQ